jgi:RNA-splicing ligase RtcB
MLEYQGQYGHAKVMIDKVESSTVQQIYEFLNHEAFTNPIAIMPDTHAGAGAVIGFTMELTDKVIPNVIGVDIGCGMLAQEFHGNLLDGKELSVFDREIRNSVPFGISVHKPVGRERAGRFNDQNHNPFWQDCTKAVYDMSKKFNQRFGTNYNVPVIDRIWFQELCEKVGMIYERAVLSVGTLGGGNHFIEVGKDLNNHIWITVHSGSRQLGQKIAVYHQRKAKKLGRKGPLGWLDGLDMFEYLIDMVFAQKYASENRHIMQWLIHLHHNQTPISEIETIHNYINFDDFIMRKGAISSYENERMIIPFSMLDGILICEGKGNKEWNYSAPHGAGRLGSRRWAKDTLSKKNAEKAMRDAGIYFSKLPIDEVAGAYKDPKIIEQCIAPTAEIINRVKPIIAMKD